MLLQRSQLLCILGRAAPLSSAPAALPNGNTLLLMALSFGYSLALLADTEGVLPDACWEAYMQALLQVSASCRSGSCVLDVQRRRQAAGAEGGAPLRTAGELLLGEVLSGTPGGCGVLHPAKVCQHAGSMLACPQCSDNSLASMLPGSALLSTCPSYTYTCNYNGPHPAPAKLQPCPSCCPQATACCR